MKLIRSFIWSIVLAPAIFGANKDMQALQRELYQVQQEIRNLQDQLKLSVTELKTLSQQANTTAAGSTTAIAVLESGMRDRLAEQQKQVAAPVAAMGVKIDQMATEFQMLRESISDLTERMNKMQTQLVDVTNTIKVLNAPPSPPPTTEGASADAGSSTPPAGMSAKQVYETAMRDRSGGNLDLAMEGFRQYLRYFGATELAPNAQFYIGQIHYDKNEFEPALQAFDSVLEKYPDNSKTPDAAYMKGMALLKSGQRNEAGREFLNVITKYPNAEVAAKARNQRKALGLSVPATPPASARTRRR